MVMNDFPENSKDADLLRVESSPIYTIGYGSRSIDEFVQALQHYRIQYLGDVRTRPYSRFKVDFSGDSLRYHLATQGIVYVHLGDTLGGMPDDPDCYTDERVDYSKMRQSASFRSGLARLKVASERQIALAIMCSEGKPEQCHRSKLIGESLTDIGVPVLHIDETGSVITQREVMRKINSGQTHLPGFATAGSLSRKRYTDVSTAMESQE